MSSNVIDSTPAHKEKETKKRTLSSPVDLFDSKKPKPAMAQPEMESMPTPVSDPHTVTSIALTEQNIAQISTIVKESLKLEMPLLVSTIVNGVLDGLQKKITSLEEENGKLRSRVTALEVKLDKAEQYSRRNCLRLSGIKEKDGESVDSTVMEIANAIGANLSLVQVDRTHRLGKKKDSGKPRDIIIKFASYRSRQKVLANKKHLKDSAFKGAYINENLTITRNKIFYTTRQLLKDKMILGTWTIDGVIMIKDKHEKLHRIETIEELEEFQTNTL